MIPPNKNNELAGKYCPYCSTQLHRVKSTGFMWCPNGTGAIGCDYEATPNAKPPINHPKERVTNMRVLDQAIEAIEAMGRCGGSETLADCVASACNSRHKVAFIDLSVRLDRTNMRLARELMDITKEPDFCNTAQDNALRWLAENEYI